MLSSLSIQTYLSIILPRRLRQVTLHPRLPTRLNRDPNRRNPVLPLLAELNVAEHPRPCPVDGVFIACPFVTLFCDFELLT